MSKIHWAIVDRDNRVVGRWEGNYHYVPCYEKYKDAKLDAIARKIPNFTIANAVWAMQLPPSPHSQI
ncbi:MAG: hypothetical protein ACRC2R_16940 [Xenococcaceae cyanobacterium]